MLLEKGYDPRYEESILLNAFDSVFRCSGLWPSKLMGLGLWFGGACCAIYIPRGIAID